VLHLYSSSTTFLERQPRITSFMNQILNKNMKNKQFRDRYTQVALWSITGSIVGLFRRLKIETVISCPQSRSQGRSLTADKQTESSSVVSLQFRIVVYQSKT
jgi:hypothetical protein